MPRQKTITLYTFAELSPEAQKRAIERYRVQERQSSDTYWAEPVLEDAERMAGLLGIELKYHDVPLMNGTKRRAPNIWWSLGYCQSDFACIEGRYSYAAGAHRTIRKEAPQDTELHAIADLLLQVQKEHRYSLIADITHHHNRGCQIEVDKTTDPNEFEGADAGMVKQAIERFNRWIYKSLDQEWTYQQSDEHAREVLEGNDDEYDEHGSLES